MASWGLRDSGPGFSNLVKSVASDRQQPKHQTPPTARKDLQGELVEEGESEEEEDDEDEEELLANAMPYGEEEEEEGEGSEEGEQALFEVQARSNFTAVEDGDLSFKEREILRVLESSRDDGWLLAENALGERGLIPGNYVQRISADEQPSRTTTPATRSITPRRGRDLWVKLRTNVKQTSLADVLSALGAIPSGFRDSTLAKLLMDSATYLPSTWVFPIPSLTGMAFRDLKWDHTKDQLQPKNVKITRKFSIVAARMIPHPGKGVQVLSRHVRVAVFNKNDILSNIHTVRAVWNPQEERTWTFAPKAQTIFNTLYHQVCVARVDTGDPNVELLFELGITFKREKTGESGELSCGWSALPLFEHSGNPVPNRTFELKVHGGTPFESGVDVDSARHMKASGGLLPSILRANQTSRLYVRTLNPTRDEKSAFTFLPSTIVTCSRYVNTIGCFRQLVGMAFLKGRLGLTVPNSVDKPALNVLLTAIDQPDVTDTTLSLWNERVKQARRSDKQNLKFLSEQLEKVLLEHTYPLLHSPSLPPTHWADEKREKERLQFIEDFSMKTLLTSMLAADTTQCALNITEQIFSIYP